MVNYYQVLGLDFGASVEQVRKAYREYAKHFHPDRHNSSEFFTEQFKSIQQAHSVLIDEVKRAEYEQEFLSYFDSGDDEQVSQLQDELNQKAKDNKRINKELRQAKSTIARLTAEVETLTSERATVQSKKAEKKVEASSKWKINTTDVLAISALLVFIAIVFAGYSYYDGQNSLNLRAEIENLNSMLKEAEWDNALKKSNQILNADLQVKKGTSVSENGDTLSILDVLAVRGIAKWGLNDSTGAIKDFTLVFQNGGCYRDYLLHKLRAELKLQMGDTLGGFHDFSSSIDEYPMWSTYQGRAELLFQKGLYDRALNDYRAAVSMNESNGELLNNLAICYGAVEKIDSACYTWRRAGKLGSAEAYSNLNKFCK